MFRPALRAALLHAALCVGVLGAGCGSSPPGVGDGGGLPFGRVDGGPLRDGGDGLEDGGVPDDGGVFDDGGSTADGGALLDGGRLSDGGSPLDGGGSSDGGNVDAGLIDAGTAMPFTRATTTTCRFTGSADSTPDMAVEQVFAGAPLSGAVQVTHAPGSDRIFVVEQTGRIKVFPNRPDVAAGDVRTFLDIVSKVQQGSNEQGLLALAFHPRFAENRYFYVYYSPRVPSNERKTVIARYQASAADPSTNTGVEQILLEIPQPYTNHKGGTLAFGPDGYLYLGTGDGGSAGDPENRAQNRASLLGKVLRIDVDNTQAGLSYAIPADNPFVNEAGTRGEIWALGMRNPWRMSFDRVTQRLWAGDVGQGAWEEVDIITRGANYGWRRMEGNACYNPSTNCQDPSFTAPVHAYSHADGCSITGGFVYRGSRLPELYGAYLYGDYCSGSIWALRYDGARVTENRRIARSGLNVSSFGEDRDGEVYVVSISGTLHRFNRRADAGVGVAFPATLSATGCYADLATKQVANGLVPYDLIAPLWSDGDAKRRFFFVPGGQSLGYAAAGGFALPEGTILMKEFYVETVRDSPAGLKIAETRFLLKRGGVLEGYAYRWNDAGTEGTLLPTAATSSYTTVEQNGAITSRTHLYPSREQCTQCHTQAAGGTLGLQAAQMNRDFDYGAGGVANQLRAFAAAGLFGDGGLPGPADSLPRLTDPANTAASFEARSRSYLHANCAGCHRPGGGTPGAMDLRIETPLRDAALCDAMPTGGDLGVVGAKILKPVTPDSSLLWLRLSRRGDNQMPPIASNTVDPAASALVREWITSVTSCP